MTDPTISVIHTASAATTDILHGRAFTAILAERFKQVEPRGHTLAHDLTHNQAELALAAKSYLDTYIDLALSPELRPAPGDIPISWPWRDAEWKEPTPEQSARALVKGIALAWAELDRLYACMAIAHAARPLVADNHFQQGEHL